MRYKTEEDERYARVGAQILKGYHKRRQTLDCLRAEQNRRRHTPPQKLELSGSGAYMNASDAELDRAVAYLSAELELADRALMTLDPFLRSITRDIYVNRVTWTKASMKWSMSESGICRRMQKAALELGRVLCRLPEELVPCASAAADRQCEGGKGA